MKNDTQAILTALEPLQKKCKCDRTIVTIEHWSESKPYVTAAMYSKELTQNHQAKYSFSATTPLANFNVEALKLKLEGEYLEAISEQSAVR